MWWSSMVTLMTTSKGLPGPLSKLIAVAKWPLFEGAGVILVVFQAWREYQTLKPAHPEAASAAMFVTLFPIVSWILILRLRHELRSLLPRNLSWLEQRKLQSMTTGFIAVMLLLTLDLLGRIFAIAILEVSRPGVP